MVFVDVVDPADVMETDVVNYICLSNRFELS